MALSRRLLSRRLLLSTSTSLVRAPIYSVSVSLRLVDHGRTNFDFISKAFAWQEMTPTVGERSTPHSSRSTIRLFNRRLVLVRTSTSSLMLYVSLLYSRQSTAHDIHYVHSTTTRAGMVRSSTRVARQMTSSLVFGLNWRRSTLITIVSLLVYSVHRYNSCAEPPSF